MQSTEKGLTRRAFLGASAMTAGAWLMEGCRTFEQMPRLRFGVISDVHIGGRKAAPERLRFTLDWLARHNVDAVLSPGDVAHSGLISELEQFAAIWQEAFPGGRAADGRTVKFLMSTGNHEAAAVWVKGTDAWRAANVLAHGDNFPRTWERLFGEKWELVWKREVRGYTFIGSQWSTLNPPVEAFFAEHARELKSGKPFFYCQHAHPRGTCHGPRGPISDATATKILSAFPNAVAFSGHSHYTIADESTVWQGAFTSIGAGSLHEGGVPYSYDNVTPFWYPPTHKHLMGSLNDPEEWGGDEDGGCFELVEVYDDHLRVMRRSSVWDLPIGPDWIVPLPANAGGPFDGRVRKESRSAPEFAADAVVRVEECPNGHPLEGKTHKGEPCVYVSFPPALPVNGCRVFDYLVTATAGGKVVGTSNIFAPGGACPEEKADRVGEALFALKDLPGDGPVTFSVVPRECFGKAGRAIAAVWEKSL